MIMSRSTPHRILFAIGLATATLCGCSQDATRVQLTIEADAAWRLDDYQLRVATAATSRSVRADVQRALTVVVPDEMAANATTIDVWGLAVGQQVAYGKATVMPALHGAVSATVTLSAVSCGLWCEPGAVACEHDGVTACEQDTAGCMAWSMPIACPTEMPYCSNGACAAQCSDECSTGGAVCDSTVARRTCGQFDSDSCLDWSPAAACPSGKSCTGGACMGTVACSGDGAACDDGNACTLDDRCDGGVCGGTPQCSTAPAHGEPTCASNGTCDFTCDPGFMKLGTSCALVSPAPMPTARSSLAVAAGPDGKIYAIGGFGGNEVAKVEAFDPVSNTWATRAPISTARWGMAAVAGSDGRIYAIGGQETTSFVATVEAYDPITNMWTARAPMPTARVYPAAARGPDGRIYAIGGYTDAGETTAVEAYDPATNMWAQRQPLPVATNTLAAALGSDGRIYAIGGSAGGSVLRTVLAYDPVMNAWSSAPSMPSARTQLAAVGLNGRIYAIGGYRSTPSGCVAIVESYDSATQAWTTQASLPTARCSLSAAAGTNGVIYAIGGFGASGAGVAVEAYDPLTDTWR